jgi:creatinine amidohydrolase/Fe(II)-dependent formamide hydrolase-like protein
MSAPAQVRAELLSPDEIEVRLRQHPIVYIPLGTLEFHGPHLPIGLDALTAHTGSVSRARLEAVESYFRRSTKASAAAIAATPGPS